MLFHYFKNIEAMYSGLTLKQLPKTSTSRETASSSEFSSQSIVSPEYSSIQFLIDPSYGAEPPDQAAPQATSSEVTDEPSGKTEVLIQTKDYSSQSLYCVSTSERGLKLGDKISFVCTGGVLNYSLTIEDCLQSLDEARYRVAVKIPGEDSTFSLSASTTDILFLSGRLENCLYYMRFEEGSLAAQAENDFHEIFNHLPLYDDVGSFLSSNKLASFRYCS